MALSLDVEIPEHLRTTLELAGYLTEKMGGRRERVLLLCREDAHSTSWHDSFRRVGHGDRAPPYARTDGVPAPCSAKPPLRQSSFSRQARALYNSVDCLFSQVALIPP